MKKYLTKYYLLVRNIPYLLFTKKPEILSTEKTIEDIIATKKSFSRFGDGEIRMFLDSGEIGFQNRNLDLTERLREVLNSNLPNLLIGLPNTFKTLPQNTLASQIFWYGFNMIYARQFLHKIDIRKVYGDTNITRFYIAYRNKNNEYIQEKVDNLRRIWNDKDVLIVEGEKTRLGVNNDLFSNAKSINRIICPSKNAFSRYDDIFAESHKRGHDKLILIALGPTATVLSYDLAKIGLWAIDIGHIDVEYMWYLQKANHKVSIVGKSVNEASHVDVANDTADSDSFYSKSIIHKI